MKPGYECDHINSCPFDNRKENLRWVTSAENKQNKNSREKISENSKNAPHSYKKLCIFLRNEIFNNPENINKTIEEIIEEHKNDKQMKEFLEKKY